MQLPKMRNEVNWTGIALGVAPLLLTIGGWVWAMSGLYSDVETLSRDFNTYQMAHSELHKEAKSGNSAQFADLNARLITQESLNAQYRLVALEAQMKAFENSITKLNTDFSDARTEIRLMSQQMGQIIEYIRGGAIPPRSTP